MSELIDREAAIRKIEPWLYSKGRGESEINMLRAVIDTLKNMTSAPRWHRVEEPPKEYGRYLVFMFTSGLRWEFKFAGYLHGKWVNTGGGDVRYWMPLPEPPKEDA